MKRQLLAAVSLVLMASNAFADARSPYIGEESREIKALSQQDVKGYLEGKGMGFAKAAELNHYPGPRHVLDLADQLKLSTEQSKQTLAIFDNMKMNASDLGKRLVDKEAELDQRFASGNIDDKSLAKLLTEIGELTAQLRYVHLNAHLQQQALLTPQQVKHYDHLRGYGEKGQQHHNADHQHMHGN